VEESEKGVAVAGGVEERLSKMVAARRASLPSVSVTRSGVGAELEAGTLAPAVASLEERKGQATAGNTATSRSGELAREGEGRPCPHSATSAQRVERRRTVCRRAARRGVLHGRATQRNWKGVRVER